MTDYIYPDPSVEAKYPFTVYDLPRMATTAGAAAGAAFRDKMATRRSIRTFSTDPVPQRMIELAIETALRERFPAARGLIFGGIFYPDGRRLASVAQEALIRTPKRT